MGEMVNRTSWGEIEREEKQCYKSWEESNSHTIINEKNNQKH